MTRMSTEKLRLLRGMVNRVLETVDLEGLRDCGPRPYKAEANTIVRAIEKGQPITPEYIRDVWLYWFGTAEDQHGIVEVLAMPMDVGGFRAISDQINVILSDAIGP